jgi:NADH:ubiquinone oxidoreductase subunit 6 (subunit J)
MAIRKPVERHPGVRNRAAGITVLFLCLFLSGCVTLRDPETSLEYTADVVGTISSGQSIGQTLVSRRPGFNGIQLWLRSTSPPSSPGEVVNFELYHTPQDTQPLATVPITYTVVTRSFPLTISFPPQHDPPDQSYYLLMRIKTGSLQVLGRLEDAYPGGQLLINGVPQQADSAFRSSYDYDLAAMLGDVRSLIPRFWLLFPLLAVLWLPGRILLDFCGGLSSPDDQPLDWGQRAALSIGLSLALIPLVMLWTTTLGLRWNRASLLIVALAIAGAYIWRRLRRYPRFSWSIAAIDKSSLLLFGIILFSLIIRLVMVRDLAAPAWVDPVHHATIVRAIVDQGGYPQNYEPYVDVDSAGYHPGFHSVVASFHWLSGLDISSAMLLLGQVLNTLTVLAVYLFTMTFTQDRNAGLVAASIPAFFSPMPAYYASWGRYTQLDGLLILPACMVMITWFLKDAWRARLDLKTLGKEQWRLILLVSLACGGLAITHYRVIIILGALLVAYLFAQTIHSLDKKPLWQSFPTMVILVGIVVTGAVLVTLPWWPRFFVTTIAPRLDQAQAASQPLKIDWGYLTPVYGRPVMILAGLGLVWSIVRARWFGLTLALWIGLLFMLANQGIIHLPRAGFVNKTSVEIMLFMPFAVLAGYPVGCLVHAGKAILPIGWRAPFQVVLLLVGFALALMGSRSLLSILNPITFLIREADKPALIWVQENLPSDETILINPFHWNTGVYAGQDGGYWITPMTGHKSIPPPVLYDLGDQQEKNRINQICRQVIDQGKDPENLYTLMQSQNIRYVYLGARGGVLSPGTLQRSPLFRLLYNHGGVWIFKLQ